MHPKDRENQIYSLCYDYCIHQSSFSKYNNPLFLGTTQILFKEMEKKDEALNMKNLKHLKLINVCMFISACVACYQTYKISQFMPEAKYQQIIDREQRKLKIVANNLKNKGKNNILSF